MNNDTIAHIDVTALYPHPNNPRIEPREDIIEQIAQRIANGFDPSHALIVRPIDGGYQIISGHHRVKAAERANLPTVPCWVRDLSDADAYMQLVLCNTQSELHALEEGKHAAESGMDLKAYAEAAGKERTLLMRKRNAWRVVDVCNVAHATELDHWMQFAEIHAAPDWLWPALVGQMLGDSWTVAVTREKVKSLKTEFDPYPFWNLEKVSASIVSGSMRLSDMEKAQGRVDDAYQPIHATSEVNGDEWAEVLKSRLLDANPSSVSDVMAVINSTLADHANAVNEVRQKAAATQRAEENAQARVVNLRKNCSLDEWKGLSDEERAMLLAPEPGTGGSFNKQDNDAIEWAQWSWNPVTGCKHDCPYCYARDIAQDPRYKSAFPNGFYPTFRSLSLNGPKNTKVPKEAATDTRYRNVFTCSMADLFGRWVPKEWIDAVMLAAKGNPQWNFLFLTKFPQRLAEIEIPDNAWMGTSVDMQARVKNAERAFESVKGGVKWLSVEPMIEPLKFERLDLFDWVVIGGASSSTKTPAWRPPFEWVYDLVTQARESGCKVYMKTNLFGEPNKDGKGAYRANARILELPFDAPIIGDPMQAPEVFRYLGKG